MFRLFFFKIIVSTKFLFYKLLKRHRMLWRTWVGIMVVFKILHWFVSKPKAQKIQEYELSTGEYKITVKDKK